MHKRIVLLWRPENKQIVTHLHYLQLSCAVYSAIYSCLVPSTQLFTAVMCRQRS